MERKDLPVFQENPEERVQSAKLEAEAEKQKKNRKKIQCIADATDAVGALFELVSDLIS